MENKNFEGRDRQSEGNKFGGERRRDDSRRGFGGESRGDRGDRGSRGGFGGNRGFGGGNRGGSRGGFGGGNRGGSRGGFGGNRGQHRDGPSLGARVEVLEKEVAALKETVAKLTGIPIASTLVETIETFDIKEI